MFNYNRETKNKQMNILNSFIVRFKEALRRMPVGKSVQLMFKQDEAPTYSKQTYETFVKEGYTRNELIYACIDRTAKTAASVKLQLKKKSGKVVTDGELRDLLDRPNELMTEFTFWWLTITMLLLAGNCYWQKVRNSKTGAVIALWPMRPDWCIPVAGTKSFIEKYKYGPDESNQVLIPYADVLSFQFFDPRNLYQVVSPTAIACRVGDTDNAVTDLIKLFMERGGIPNAILTSKLKLDDDDVTDIRRRWVERYGGWESLSGAPAVLDMDSTYQQIQMNFKDMEFSILDARNETRICLVYDIPPIMLGTTVGMARSTFNNIGEAESLWWRNSLKPRYKMLADEILLDLVYEFDPSLIAEFDYSEVSALQEDRSAKFIRANGAVTAGYYTINMALEETQGELLPPESGDVFLWTPATTPVHIDMIAEKIMLSMDNTRMANEAMKNPPADSANSAPSNSVDKPKQGNSGKAVYSAPESALIVKVMDHDQAVAVEPFSQNEIDMLFDEWKALPKKP